jgi:hypothetical protein
MKKYYIDKYARIGIGYLMVVGTFTLGGFLAFGVEGILPTIGVMLMVSILILGMFIMGEGLSK